MTEKNDITKLSNELTYHRYMINQKQVASLFEDISIPQYIALHSIAKSISDKEIEKTYLKDIADELEIPISNVSKMIAELRERGLVLWEHEGNGSEGTYVTITESGIRLMNQQQTILKNYYSRVIEKFGEDKLVLLLKLMKELEDAMDYELSDKGENLNDNRKN